jgi:hypothetical protein
MSQSAPLNLFIDGRLKSEVEARLTNANYQPATPATHHFLSKRRKFAPHIGRRARLRMANFWNFACHAKRAHRPALFQCVLVGSTGRRLNHDSASTFT